MATWGSYLGLGKRAEPAPTPVVAQPEDVSEKFEIRPFDPSSIYGGKGAENTIVEPIIKATAEVQPGFIRGSRRTQSDSTIPQPPPTIAPRRTQSNASRVARLFGYGAPVEEDPQIEKIPTGPTDPEPKPRVSQEQVIPVVQRTPEEEIAGTARRTAFRNIVKVATQPKMLKVVDEAIEQEEERKFLEFERISEQIRMEKEAMEAERDKMFQAQEKMRIELERMAQEEAEMFEYCKIMGIEEPRPLKKVMIEEPPPVKVDDSELRASKERERLLQIRRERQLELDREIERQEAKRLEEEQLALKEVETFDSESEYEDEYVDDEEDGIAERLRMEEDGVAERLRMEEEEERLRAKKEYEADLRRHEEEMAAEKLRLEEEEFNREVEQMEADRIARALKRAAQAEKKRLEQMELDQRAQDRRAAPAREMEKVRRLEEERLEAERFEAERFEAERLENQRLETQRFEEEESRRQEKFRRQELERKARETADNLMREQEERELLAREQERLEDERIAEQSRFEEQRRLSQQRRIDAEAKAEMERQNAQARADEEAAEAAEAAFEKEEEIRKAEEKMRKAFAAMAAEKGGIPVAVPSVLPALFPAGQNSLRKKKELSERQPEGISQPFRQNALMPRPSIKGGLPTGPRGGASPPRRNPSIDQKLPAFQRTSPQRPSISISEEAIMSPNRSNTLGPRPSIRGGLPNGPRAGGGGLPIRRNQSVDQRNPIGNIPPVRKNQLIDQGLPGRPGGSIAVREPMFI